MSRLARVFVFIEETVPAILMGVMVAIIVVDVFGRYIFYRPLMGAGELATILLIWQVFLGAAAALRRHQHVAIEYFVRMLPARGQALAQFAVYAVLLAFALLMTKLGWDLVVATSDQFKLVVNVSYTYIYAAVPLGFGLMSVHLLFGLVGTWRALMTGRFSRPIGDLHFGLTEKPAASPVDRL